MPSKHSSQFKGPLDKTKNKDMLYTNKASSSITTYIYIYIVAITLNDSLVLVLRDRGSFEIWLVDDFLVLMERENRIFTITDPRLK